MSWTFNPFTGTLDYFLSADLSVTDDGTNYIISYSGTTLFKIRKSDNQLLLDAGVDTDAY